MDLITTALGSIPESAVTATGWKGWKKRASLSGQRALRTFLQAVAAALVGSGPGSATLSVSYWEALEVALLGAVLTGIASFLQNMASFLPSDPGQNPRPAPQE